MSKLFMLLSGMITFCYMALGQGNAKIVGVVMDENNKALIGASVYIKSVQKGTLTNTRGEFTISNLKANTYVIEITFIGYKTLMDTINVNNNETIYTARLKLAPLSLQEVVVSDHYAENRKKEESLNIEIVNDKYLKQNLGGSLMSSLERLPGISTIGIGSGQSKPVIRGLGFNRVIVVENNIKHEAQQWGTDHGLEIDQYAVENVEVIKGPASLMYGSDAIGGVIDMRNRKVPAKNTFGGVIDLTGKTNNGFLGTSLSAYGRKKAFYADLRATIIDYGDYKVPTDSVNIYSYKAALYKNHLRNTAGKETNLHLSVGYLQKSFQNKLYASSVNTKNGFFANAHGLEPRNVDTDLHDKSNRDIQYPFQTVNHLKLINLSQYKWEQTKLQVDLGFQRNFRQEWSQYTSHGYMPPVFPDTLNFNADLERQFEKYVYSGNLKLYTKLNEKNSLNFGVSGEYHDNRIDGRGFIIPAYKQTSLGAFAYAKHAFSVNSTFQIGIRYNFGTIVTKEYYDWFQSPVIENGDTTMEYLQRAKHINRSFTNLTWSVGYNYSSEQWSYKINAGKSFRVPIANELASNGVNYHRFSYEVGNPELSPEVSFQLDVGAEYTSEMLAFGATPFANYFSNYIYLNPSDEHDRLYGNGNQVYYYTESKVFRYGGEIHAHYEPVQSIQLGVMAEYVYSEQLSGSKKGYTLPFSPPPSVLLSAKYFKPKIGLFKTPFLSVDYRLTAAQNNIVPPEETTSGYQVINVRSGGSIKVKNQDIDISIQVKNLFNTRYFNHTSFYRLINLPEQGRNFIINVSIPFYRQLKQK